MSSRDRDSGSVQPGYRPRLQFKLSVFRRGTPLVLAGKGGQIYRPGPRIDNFCSPVRKRDDKQAQMPILNIATTMERVDTARMRHPIIRS